MSYLNQLRVPLAVERTLIARNRTAVALKTTGSIIEYVRLFVKFMHPNPIPGQRERSFWLGLSLIGSSIVMHRLPAWPCIRGCRGLSSEEKPPADRRWSTASLNRLVALLGAGLPVCLGHGSV